MEQYPFYIEVVWGYWDNNKFHQKQEGVILFAENYAAAAGKIEQNYEAELVSINHIECMNDCCSITIPTRIGRRFMEDVNDYETGKIPVETYDEKQTPIEWDIRDPFPENVPSGTMIIAVRK